MIWLYTLPCRFRGPTTGILPLAPLPRAYTVNDYKIATTSAGIFDSLSDPYFSPQKTAILEKDPGIIKQSNPARSQVQITNDKPLKVKILTNLDSESILILSDSLNPGWKATVDGQETEIIRANINSRAVVVGGGKHSVEFLYVPTYLKFSLIITVLSSLIFLIFFFKSMKKKWEF